MEVREKLVELLKRTDREVYEALKDREDYREEMLWDYFASNLIAHGVTVQEWIPVKDRLPGKKGRYLTANEKDDGEIYVFDLLFDCQKWYIDEGDDLFIYKVTHWMPLPQPPKGE